MQCSTNLFFIRLDGLVVNTCASGAGGLEFNFRASISNTM